MRRVFDRGWIRFFPLCGACFIWALMGVFGAATLWTAPCVASAWGEDASFSKNEVEETEEFSGNDEFDSLSRALAAEKRTDASELQFRVDNVSRFIRNERVATYLSSTVFYDDMVFDFVGENGEIVVYSFQLQKFTLIDPIRRMRTEIDESEIDRFLDRIKVILKDKNDGFSTFMTDPAFEISRKDDELFFQSKWIDYRATTSSFESEEQADAYFRFADAMGKLNVYMNPGVVTPLARMVANRKFMQESLFPKKVVSEIYPKGKTIFTKTFQVENEASLSRRLSERDRSRINRAIHFFAQFPYVSFKTYFEKTSER